MKFSFLQPLRHIQRLARIAPNSTPMTNLLFSDKRATPRVYVDVTSMQYADHGGGIQRVQRELLASFAKIQSTDFVFTPVFFCSRENKFKLYREVPIKSEGITNLIRDEDVVFCSEDVYLNLDLNYAFYIEHETLLQELKKNGIRRFTIIYDLLPISMPAMFPDHVPPLHSKWIKIAAKWTTPICISHHVKEELYEWGEGTLLKKQIEVIELGGNILNHEIQDADEFYSKSCKGLNFLVVSTIEPRKCHNQILQAFEILWAEGIAASLTFVGQAGWHTEEVVKNITNHPRNGKNLFWFQKITDSDLRRLYRNSSALINASLGEGFGLPLREAITHELPLILRDIKVFREVAGEGAWFFVADSPKELASAIKEWVKAYELGEIKVVRPDKLPSWEDTCSQIIAIIQDRTVN